MRTPKESLDDFIVAAPEPAEPPTPRSVRATGKVKMLEPLTSAEDLSKSKAAAGLWVRQLSWFHRSLVVTGGLAFVVFLLSSIYLGTHGPSTERDSDNIAGSRQRKG